MGNCYLIGGNMGIGYAEIISTLGLIIQAWGAWGHDRKPKLEKIAKELVTNPKIAEMLEKDNNFKNYFFSIFEKILKDHREEKMQYWKHCIINLAINFNNFDLKDNFLKILDDLTYFDLSVLNYIYYKYNDKQTEYDRIIKNIVQHFVDDGFGSDLIKLSLAHLSANRLIESVDSRYNKDLGALEYSFPDCLKNEFGNKFIEFIIIEYKS